MALFGKKKRTLDEILEDVKGLTPEEVKELHEKTSDLYKAEDEREIDKIEEEKADSDAVKDEKSEEVSEESEEIGKDVDEIKDEVKADEAAEPVDDTYAEDKATEALGAMAARLATIEEKYSVLIEKVEAMADRLDGGNFGNPRGTPPEGNEDAEGEESRIMNSYYRKQGDARRT